MIKKKVTLGGGSHHKLWQHHNMQPSYALHRFCNINHKYKYNFKMIKDLA